MKKTLLLFILIAITLTGFSQIKKIKPAENILIGKIAPMGGLQIECIKSGDTYTFTYRDVKYTQIVELKSFEFKDVDNAFEDLYKMIIDGLENPPKEDIMLELPNDIIWLSFTKAMGIANFRFGHSVSKSDAIGFSGWLTEKKVNKLFGKK